jgi:hypothetical protein
MYHRTRHRMLLETEMLLFDSDSDDELIILVAFAAMQEQERLNSKRRSRSRSSRPCRKRPRPHRVIEEPPPMPSSSAETSLSQVSTARKTRGRSPNLLKNEDVSDSLVHYDADQESEPSSDPNVVQIN